MTVKKRRRKKKTQVDERSPSMMQNWRFTFGKLWKEEASNINLQSWQISQEPRSLCFSLLSHPDTLTEVNPLFYNKNAGD